MNIRLFRSCSVPIWISLQELHQQDTCFLHEVNFMERYVTTTFRLHELNCIERYYEFISMYMYSLSVRRASVLDWPGMSFGGEAFVRSLCRHGVTLPLFLERTFPSLIPLHLARR